jgi:hypothetical protein
VNGKTYVGKHKTDDLDDGYMGSGKLLKAAIRKHGLENFVKEILEVHETEEAMNEAEARLVELGPNSYNLCPGGQGGWGYVNENGLNDTEKKRAAALKSFPKAQERQRFLLKNDEAYRNRFRHRISEGQKGRIGSFTGRRHTEEAKMKMQMIDRTRDRNSQWGTRWMNLNGAPKKVRAEEVDTYVNLGYVFGRKDK